ncbi:MAG: PilT/PilU family type 4a pilus ATPase [Gemmatimonadetes bacterium]|nr:PilT/PilU family type 4a pilus ATPase [Gemmatimonadota bacterium]
MVKFNASDLHVKVGSPPGYRIDSQIQPVANVDALAPQDTLALAQQLLTPEQFKELNDRGDLDWAHSVPGLARFRVNAMKQRGSISLFFRKIPVEAPDLDMLGVPAVCKELVLRTRGLVLVTGPAGAGKSTTMAAMIAHRNANERGHILTIEDPVEFIHQDVMSFVNQREVGSDTPSFPEALQRAFRQDPDVILVSELRDQRTISLALTGAEADHLVLSTLPTTGAVQTLDRLVEYFPRDQHQQIRLQLAETLAGVVSQVLVPRVGGGLVAAHEVLIGTDDVRESIRGGRTNQLPSLMRAGTAQGMVLLDESLARLTREGTIHLEDAWSRALERADPRAPGV